MWKFLKIAFYFCQMCQINLLWKNQFSLASIISAKTGALHQRISV